MRAWKVKFVKIAAILVICVIAFIAEVLNFDRAITFALGVVAGMIAVWEKEDSHVD